MIESYSSVFILPSNVIQIYVLLFKAKEIGLLCI
jgi:hypothetical protein